MTAGAPTALRADREAVSGTGARLTGADGA